MTCPDMESKIAEFLAGELAERAGVEEHLLACGDCRAKFSTARSGWEAANSWKAAGPSGDAITATLDALEPAAPNRGFAHFLQAGTLAASLVIAFVIGTSNRVPPTESVSAPVAAAQAAPPSTGLASVRPSVGLLFVQDENGRPAGELAIRRLEVRVDIRDGIARTEIEEIFENRTDRRLEGTFQFPLPPDASISRLAMEIEGKLMEGEVVEREKARQTYEGIVRSMKDPALLEWMPGGIFQCRIFPIEPRSDKRIVIAYTQALSVFDGRARYVYPLAGESTRELGIGRFEFAATFRSSSKIVGAASTSHDAKTVRVDDRTMRTTFGHSDFRPRADFVVSFESEVRDEIQVSAHRPAGPEPGYFAAFITPRMDLEESLRRDRQLFFLIDVSGSAARSELEASRMVVRRMVGTLAPADRFRIGCHNLLVGAMPETVAPDDTGKRAAERYLGDLAPAGASDVATALETALSYVSDNGELVYIGEGTPTWGEKDPAKIVARIREAIGTRRITIRTVAVGSDAEKGLLETISREFNGGSHAISPSDDVAVRADEIARTLGRSAVSGLKAEFEGPVTDAAPDTLGSLHFGERILVAGRYGAGPVKLILTGRLQDRPIRREFVLSLPAEEPENLHVKRLWAQRRLADLVAQGDAGKAEAIKLSVENQVMTPYTSFLVLENERAYQDHRIDRSRKDADQTRDPRMAQSKRLFQEVLADYRAKRFDAVLKKCDEILAADPNHPLAAEVKEETRKARHRQTIIGEPSIEKWARGESASGNAEVRRKVDQRRELELLFAQARNHFEREEYSKVVESCDRMLSIDPRLSVVDEMKMVSQRFNHAKSDPELTRPYIEQWQRKFDEVEALGVVQNDSLSPAARDLWLKMIKKRKPKGILGADDANEPVEEMDRMASGIKELQEGTIGKLMSDDAEADATSSPAQKPANPNQPFLGDLPLIEFQLRSGGEAAPMDAWGYEASGFLGIPAQALPGLRAPDREADGSRILGVLSLDDIGTDLLNRPRGGYDVGGVGFTDLDEERAKKREREESVRQLQIGLMQKNAELAQVHELLRVADPESTLMVRLENRYQEVARERQRLEEIMAALNARGMETNLVAPRKALAGQVTAADAKQDLVVLSIGRDAGVNEGDEFTIYRGNVFVGKTTIDRVDRAWASGRMTLKGRDEPRIGDQASNNFLATPSALMRVASVSGEEVFLSGADPASIVDSIIVLSRDGRYVATVQVKELFQTTAKARIVRRLRAAPINVGDLACRVNPGEDLWSLLPDAIRKNVVSETDLAAARLKLRQLRGGAR
jgi:hypothetical protein